MTKKNRDLDAIAAEIHRHDRASVFAIGALLIEAQDQCDHGEWGPWLEQFSWKKSSAAYYMNAARLLTKVPTVGSLKLTMRTIIYLTQLDDEITPIAVKALQQVATKKHLNEEEGNRIISRVERKFNFGDWPAHVLDALGYMSNCSGSYEASDWSKIQAILKKEQPKTEEEAREAIDRALYSDRPPSPSDDGAGDFENDESDADESESDAEERERQQKEEFLIRANEARSFAVVTGKPDEDKIKATRAVVEAWTAILIQLETATGGRKIDSKIAGVIARAEVRSRLN